MFNRNPRFIGYKFPSLSAPETLEKRYVGKLSQKAINLMSGMLEMDETQRLTALECLAHPYFDGIREQEIEILLNEKRSGMKSKSALRTEPPKNSMPITAANKFG